MLIDTIIVITGMIGVIVMLVCDQMRPGFVLFASSILFMSLGVISPEELISGFSNQSVMTVAMLFLIGEGVKQSGLMRSVVKFLLPNRRRSIPRILLNLLPAISTISMALNNTAVVIIFAPIVKQWANKLGVATTKLLIPLSYATIFGGMCTLIGTSTNMVVNGMIQNAGFKGFTLFELGKVGGVIAVVGITYLILFSSRLLPNERPHDEDEMQLEHSVEIVLTARFSGLNKTLSEYSFHRHYHGARVVSIKQNGERVQGDISKHIFSEGDALLLETDNSFTRTWNESTSFFIVVSNEDEQPEEQTAKFMVGAKRWISAGLLVMLIVGSIFGEHLSKYAGNNFELFPFIALMMVIMAFGQLFPVKRYSKFISWDVIIAIAAAFAINQAMLNSGVSSMLAQGIVRMSGDLGAYGAMAMLFVVTMLFSELITNNAAVAISFPVALAVSEALGVDPMPMFVAITIAASTSFSSPIGYQTNLIVQSIGGYKFLDYMKVGLPLNLISFIISMLLIPQIWSFEG